MARLHGEVVVAALPRGWVEEYVRAMLDHAASLTLDDDGWIQGDEDLADVTLVEGNHLTAGARYQRHTDPADGAAGNGTTSEMVLTSWERRREVSADITTWHPSNDRTTWTVRLRNPDALETVVVGGAHHAGKRYHRLSWIIRIDCRRWWRLAEARGSRGENAPVTAQLRHRLAQGRLEVSPAAADGGTWRLGLTLAVRGRGWLRPFAAVGLLFGRRALENKFREMIEEAAEGWNEEISRLRELDPREADLWLAQLQAMRSQLDRRNEEDD
ncbi:hypothetical protein EDD27_7833 [Nonomuraea polychroma]|uniref:Uncharacterized protein n=1 Tax=Nonomuraea polychroma TaxID=46176 RepID=A0A438MHD4_9ACTN|nr:hypothetical protein [Nonomuraea polychroma]RVX45056.1 hypothetical protein EDD27_7833 [Nonomuraea polychroma]